jgi:hypothetical protein
MQVFSKTLRIQYLWRIKYLDVIHFHLLSTSKKQWKGEAPPRSKQIYIYMTTPCHIGSSPNYSVFIHHSKFCQRFTVMWFKIWKILFVVFYFHKLWITYSHIRQLWLKCTAWTHQSKIYNVFMKRSDFTSIIFLIAIMQSGY